MRRLVPRLVSRLRPSRHQLEPQRTRRMAERAPRSRRHKKKRNTTSTRERRFPDWERFSGGSSSLTPCGLITPIADRAIFEPPERGSDSPLHQNATRRQHCPPFSDELFSSKNQRWIPVALTCARGDSRSKARSILRRPINLAPPANVGGRCVKLKQEIMASVALTQESHLHLPFLTAAS